MNRLIALVALALILSASAALASDAPVSVQLVTDAERYGQGEPIIARLIVRNKSSETVPSRYRDNRDFRTSDFRIGFRRQGEPLGKRSFQRSNAKRGGYGLKPSAELRFEFALMPGLIREDSFDPLPAGTYELVALLTLDQQTVESAPVVVRITQTVVADTGPGHAMDRHLVNYVEDAYWMRLPYPPAAAHVLEQMPQSKLAALLTEGRLLDRWRRLIHDRDLWERAPQELRRKYEDLKRDLTAHMSDPKFARIANFSGKLLYLTAELNFRLGELAIRGAAARGLRLKHHAMDDQTRADWQLAVRDAAAAIERLQRDCPESSFIQDAQRLVAGETRKLRNTLRRSPDLPNAPELRAALSVLERVSPRNPR